MEYFRNIPSTLRCYVGGLCKKKNNFKFFSIYNTYANYIFCPFYDDSKVLSLSFKTQYNIYSKEMTPNNIT